MPFVETNGLQTYYELHGEGETIVLLHNGFSCTKMWEGIYPILLELGYRVLMYDRRGYGQSNGGTDFFEYYNSDHFRSESADAMASLVDFLGIESFHIVGQCEGGVVGVDYAAQFPDQVKSLAAASTMCYSTTDLETFNRQKFASSFDLMSPEIQEKYIFWHGAERAEYVYSLFSKYGGCYGRGMYDLRPALQSVTCPTLVMYPDRGYFFEVEQGVAFYRNLSKGELLIFPRCGHNIFEHYPEQYVQQILAFITRSQQGVRK